jgi:hypothetical protein
MSREEIESKKYPTDPKEEMKPKTHNVNLIEFILSSFLNPLTTLLTSSH